MKKFALVAFLTVFASGVQADERWPIRGACCLDDGSCALADKYLCEAMGGVWQGPGTSCDAVRCPKPCPADFNPDGLVDPRDLIDFLGCYGGGDCVGNPDLNHDGVVDSEDFYLFLEHYFEGC